MKTLKHMLAIMAVLAIASCEKNPEGGNVVEKPWNPTDEELFADDYFDKYVDPVSGVVSYWFKSELKEFPDKYNTQSTYYLTKSMTDDLRFCYFFVSTKEKDGRLPTERSARIFDFKERKLYTFPGTDGCYPYLDNKTDVLYYFEMNPAKNGVRDGGRFWKRDLLNAPKSPVQLASLPKAVAPTGCYVNRALSHITLTQDKQWVFLDSWVNDRFIQGMLNIYTGEWDEWSRNNNEKHLTHGQINPKNDKEVFLAMDSWDDSQGVHHSIDSFYDKEKDVFPKIHIMSPDGSYRIIDPRDASNNNNNYVTHCMWHYDGDHLYWCASGVNIRNVRTGKHEYPYQKRATHCNLTYDMKYITLDNDQLAGDGDFDGWRGGRWRVTFFNRETGKSVDLITESPAITTKDKPSRIHPDPHPHFVCNDKYIVCTMADKTGYLRWSITPVDQLIRLTSK